MMGWRLGRAVAVGVAACVGVVLCPAVSSASGDAKCDRFGCKVADSVAGSSSGSQLGVKNRAEGAQYPSCSIFVDVLKGKPEAHKLYRSKSGGGGEFVRVKCREGSAVVTRWVNGARLFQLLNPEILARSLLAQVGLKPIRIGRTPLSKGPDSMGLVGLPVWLWADDPTLTTWGPVTITAGGMSLTAQARSVTWEMGDGATVTCGRGTPWRRGMVNADGSAFPSPTCGHTYKRSATYTVTATSHWVAHWTGYGRSGDIPVALTTSESYRVAELQAIVVRR